MTTDVYNNQAKKVGTVDLPDRIFGRSWNPDLVHQAVRAQTANKRANFAHAKAANFEDLAALAEKIRKNL